jgi:hypothetical protein
MSRLAEEPDVNMIGVSPKKEIETEYIIYTGKDRQMYFFLKQKGTTLSTR